MVNKKLKIMNTSIKYLIIACTTIICFACTNFEENLDICVKGVDVTITAVKEGYNPDTKTILESDGSVEWCPMDEISVFYGDGTNGGSRFTSQNTEQVAIAEFKGRLEGISAGGENFTQGKYLYGVYPYSIDTKFTDGIVTMSLPSYQTATEGTFSNGLFPTIARAQSFNLAFYNICGGVKFTVSREDITSVTFKGNNDERIAGTAKITFDEYEKPAVLDEEVESKNEITVYAPAGDTFEVGKEYYIVAYPATLNSGFTITFRTSGMKEGIYVSDNKVEIQRSVFGVLEQVDKNVNSWTDVVSNGGGENSGIYLGIMGFNQQLYSYPISELAESSKMGFDTFIDDLNTKNGTLLYYSVDKAITTMQSVPMPTDLSTVAIVTFTDGLDQGSIMMNDSYSDNTEYLNAVNHRIMNETVSGQHITAYSIGIRGQDVADVTMFQNNLKKLASKDEYATEVTSMAEVNEKFKEIAEKLSTSNYVQTITLKMPGLPNGTLVRFTFDNINSAEKSELYIEGTFNLTTRSLENVKYKGLESTSGTEIKGAVDGIFVSFTFEDVHTENNKLIDNQFTDEWTYVTSNNVWQINSEFDKTENSDIVTERSSAVIMLVLDCSSSLGSDFPKAQNNAKDFINTLYEAVTRDDNSGDNPDNTIHSTTPKDLTLAIWKDGIRYYLSKEEYDKSNLSDAVIEGVTIVSGGESFIISLHDLSDAITNTETAMALYGDIMPTETQGIIISAKYLDINNAIKNFEGESLLDKYTGNPHGYYTSSTTYDGYDFYNCIEKGSYGLLTAVNYPYVRGVKPTSYSSAIYWTDPNDLKLSVIINGKREFLDKQEYEDRKNKITSIEGVLISGGDEKFAIHLHDAQTGYIQSLETAMTLYGDIIPTAYQGEIISARITIINSIIEQFGGTPLPTNSKDEGYYTSVTTYNGSFQNCICPWLSYGYGGGFLHSVKYPYVRGVTNIK